MDIILNDQAYELQGAAGQTVQQIADEICGPPTGADAQIVVSLKCDGRQIESERLQEVLASPLSSFDRIELSTVSVREQLSAALFQAMEVLKESSRIREAAADCLNEGRHEDAMSEMRKLLESIRQIQQTTLLACQLLGIDPANLKTEQSDFNEILAQVRKSLTELKTSMENQDFVLVADLLRYELEHPLNGWQAVLKALHDTTALNQLKAISWAPF